MPRQRRPAPGELASNGGKLDLGGLLLKIFGGVESDPLYAPEDKIGEMPFDKPYQSDSPVKAKTIFDRNEASRINTEHKLGREDALFGLKNSIKQKEAEEDIRVKANIREYVEKNPHVLQFLKDSGAINNQVAADNLTKINPIKLKQKADEENIGVLTRNNIPFTDANLSNYDSNLSNPLMQAIGAKALQDREVANTTGLKAKISGSIAQGSAEDTIATGLSQSKFGRKQAEGELGEFDKLFRAKIQQAQQAPLLNEAELVRSKFLPVEGGLFNSTTGNLSYTAPPKPTEGQKLQEIMNLGKTNNYAPTTPSAPTAPTIPDPSDVITINGKTYIRRRN